MFKDFKGTMIIMVRHGECEGNLKGMFRGRTNFPLNERGFTQARDLARELKKFPLKHIYTSPLSRARQTAKAIGQECGIEVKVEEKFNNIELGSWEGRFKEEIAKLYPKEWELWVNRCFDSSFPPGSTKTAYCRLP